jgi:gliding motility-associated-like protein
LLKFIRNIILVFFLFFASKIDAQIRNFEGSSARICSNSTFTLSVRSTVPIRYKIQFYNGTSWQDLSPLYSVTTANVYSYESKTLENPTQFKLFYTTDLSPGSIPNTEHNVIVSVNVDPLPVIDNVNYTTNTICQNSSTIFTNSISGGVWSSDDVNVATVNASGTVTGVAQGNAFINYRTTDPATGCFSDRGELIYVNPTPIISSYSATVCTGAPYSVVPAGSVPAETTFNWAIPTNNGAQVGDLTGMAAAGTSTQTTVNALLTNHTNAVITATYTITATKGACASVPFNLFLDVTPKPIINDRIVEACSGANFTDAPSNGGGNIVPTGITYSWSAPTPIANIMGYASGTNQLNFNGNLSNSTNGMLTVIYTVSTTNAGCAGTTYTTTVRVNPTPNIIAKTAIICSNGSFTIIPINNGSDLVPSTTKYNWSAPSVAGINGLQSGSSQSVVSGTLSNTTNATISNIIYNITPISGTIETGYCSGPAFVLNVTVHPLPVIASVGPTQTGSGSNFNFSLGQQPSDVVPIGTTYFWGSPSVQSGITGGAASGVATQTSLVGSLTNSTGTFLDAIYTIIPSYENCPGSQFTFTVRVYPKPIIGPKTANICSGQSFIITLTDGANGDVIPNGTTYSWSAPVVTGIAGTVSATAAGTISGTLTNSTNNPITVLYIVTPFANPQSGDPFNVSVIVNPLPIASISISESSGLTANDRIICNDINAIFTAVPVVGNLIDYSYSWTVPAGTTPPGNVSGFGSNIAGTYGLQLTNINTGCTSAAQTTTSLTVNPIPTVGPIIGVNNVCVNSTISLSSSNVSGGSGVYDSYYWYDNNNLVAPPFPGPGVNVTGNTAGDALLTYRVRDDLGCFSAMSSPVFVLRINALPLAPTAVSINQIYDGLLHTGSAIANNPAAEQINWFLNSTGSTTSTPPSATNVGPTSTSYANAQNTTTGCISATRTAVSVTIIQKGLIITANDFTKTYDRIAYTGGNGVRYEGFVNEENTSVLIGTLIYTGTAQNAINAGNYLIQPSGLSANNYAVSLVAGNLVINPKGLTITGAAVQDKIYDATDRANLFAGTLVGVITADLPNIQLNRSAKFSSKNVGANLIITSTSTITGAAAPNYLLDPTINVTATISPKRIEAIGVVTANKIYDGTVVATVSGGGFNTPIAPATGNSNDKLPYVADQIQLVPSGIFTSKDVGNNISITSSSSILGFDKDNYVLDQPILTPRNITPKTLTMFGLSVAAPKIYDATQTAIVSGTPSLGTSIAPGTGTVLDGLPYNNDIVSISGNAIGTYNSKDVRTANTVTFSGLSLSGLNANNYILAIQTAVGSTILPKNLNMFGLNIPSSKVYDGNTNATVSGTPSLFAPKNSGQGNGSDGIPYIGDDVSISGLPLGNYNSSQVLSATNVQFSGLSLTGSQSSNYKLVIQANKAATITSLSIKVNATAKTKTFGDVDPVFTYTNDPLIGNDTFSGSLIRTAGEDVGSYSILIGTLTLGPNYTILYTSNLLEIIPSNLILKPNPIIRTYGDAPLPTTIVTSNFMVTGLRNNETIKSVTITLPTGLETGNGFKDPVGIYKNVIETSNLVTETADLSNYTVVLLPTDIEVIQYEIVIKAEPKKKRQTQIDPPLTYALSRPLIQGDSIKGSLFRIPGEEVGLYAIKIGTLEINDNYSITYEPDFLEILTIQRVIVVPNVFTPNNDGLNDQLKVIHNSTVVGLNYFKVFNRAGNQVFETRDLSQGWDGMVGTSIGDADAYFWILEYKTWDNKSFKLNGSTLLIK